MRELAFFLDRPHQTVSELSPPEYEDDVQLENVGLSRFPLSIKRNENLVI